MRYTSSSYASTGNKSDYISRRYLFFLALTLLAIPSIIVALCDYSRNLALSSSVCFSAGCFCVLCFITISLLLPRMSPYIYVTLDAGIAAVCIMILNAFGFIQSNFALYVLVPILMSLFVLLQCCVFIQRSRSLKSISKRALIIFLIGVISVPIEICIRKFFIIDANFYFSLIIASFCTGLALVIYSFSDQNKQ